MITFILFVLFIHFNMMNEIIPIVSLHRIVSAVSVMDSVLLSQMIRYSFRCFFNSVSYVQVLKLMDFAVTNSINCRFHAWC